MNNISIMIPFRAIIWTAALAAILFAYACSSDTQPSATTAQYPTGINEDVEKQLKYDARVQDYETDGDKLIVNVNQAWISSPPGMQERAVGQWYTLWQNSHGGKQQKGPQVVVRYDGND